MTMANRCDWRLVEELRPSIPSWFYGLLCRLSGPPDSRRWMLRQPFRTILFRKAKGRT